ncbi:MAG: hypothetical protein HN816_03305, partial [Gammaproteobacteria bacterium]|nr:hypothetical protein [Gammaproteobacteria bacterium]
MSDATSISVFDTKNLVNPYPMYKQLRDESPVHYVPELNMYYITRYDLLRKVIRDTDTYSSQYDDFMEFSRNAGRSELSEDVRDKLRVI